VDAQFPDTAVYPPGTEETNTDNKEIVMGKIVVSENVTLDGVIQDPAGGEGFGARGWVGLIGNSPQLAKLALDEALAAGALLLGRRSYEWLAARWSSRSGELADRLEQPAQVRRVRDPRQSRLEQLDSPQGRRA
jgi:dihydrofolate reductase